jgi:hypothetical protein
MKMNSRDEDHGLLGKKKKIRKEKTGSKEEMKKRKRRLLQGRHGKSKRRNKEKK